MATIIEKELGLTKLLQKQYCVFLGHIVASVDLGQQFDHYECGRLSWLGQLYGAL